MCSSAGRSAEHRDSHMEQCLQCAVCSSRAAPALQCPMPACCKAAAHGTQCSVATGAPLLLFLRPHVFLAPKLSEVI